MSGEDAVVGSLTLAALRGLSEVALDARLQYVSGGVMLDERYYSSVPALVDEVLRLREALDEAELRSIEASNPGIDMAEVRRIRGGHHGRTGAQS